MRYITQIRLEGGALHEHIARLRWKEGNEVGEGSRLELVQWLKAGGDARVQTWPRDVKVEVVDARPPYLRTKANGILTDNLLELPRF
ncbi:MULTISPECIES: DUF3892 domain-containing protein [Myxococcus]|uniref:DUF3892 domain-containing protein n=1 Tax=Myxococcus xanthus TaxID=34 RepID=A0AAE6G849_MYXXA|nr:MULTISPECIES: DUF3892 domain-containing protein [Myxococcus]QDE72376.1 hypothetical protein BHS09_10555 [Myxococcus xanthus]QDE79658.1 hypothetical protein BHS08_10570 [Myxococcus xanthus]QDE87019.1 hypothetical protein BHS07_10540 [Myxococcus xanthus]QDF01185.1 hypothetical protein BHS05_10575 [Myxococcus xanthus]QDF03705.1 hypothetical protein BHS04_10920 [Myxococcus xanthus]